MSRLPVLVVLQVELDSSVTSWLSCPHSKRVQLTCLPAATWVLVDVTTCIASLRPSVTYRVATAREMSIRCCTSARTSGAVVRRLSHAETIELLVVVVSHQRGFRETSCHTAVLIVADLFRCYSSIMASSSLPCHQKGLLVRVSDARSPSQLPFASRYANGSTSFCRARCPD